LPNKVLKPILGKAMLALQIERVRRAKLIDQLIVATSDDASDDALARLCDELNLPCFRGNLNDVLDRYYQASLAYAPDHIVRLTGDCPLADPEVIDLVIQSHLDSGADYSSNSVQASYPDGLDVEICKYAVLKRAWAEAKLLSQREHVTLFIHQQPDLFRLNHIRAQTDLSHLRWTVDNQEDFELVNTIYEKLYIKNPEFNTSDILNLLAEQPELAYMNQHIQRNEGLQKSILNEANI
jgi:spore coat polysaccharide biosynthesis protein SpsF